MKYMTLAEVQEQWANQPNAWVTWMLSQATKEGDRFGWSDSFWVHSLEFVARTKVPNPNKPVQEIQTGPTVLQMAANVAKAASDWVSGGMEMANDETQTKRKNICAGCELWDANARLGLGKCTHEKCGCTKMKVWLATSVCPLGRW